MLTKCISLDNLPELHDVQIQNVKKIANIKFQQWDLQLVARIY